MFLMQIVITIKNNKNLFLEDKIFRAYNYTIFISSTLSAMKKEISESYTIS